MNDPHKVFESLVGRFLSGELSGEEMLQFREALAKEPDLEERLEEFKKVWNSMDGMAGQRAYDMDAEWDLMRGKIPGFREDAGSGSGSRSEAKVRSLLYYTYRMAAVLVIGLVLALAWIYAGRYAGTEVVVAGAEALELMLEDGTQVVLNRESKIRFKKQFGGESREVRLAGEAWFNVARDTSRPFLIDAGEAMVEVLGTSFNVNAYRGNPMVEIMVESGVVAVSAKEDRGEQIVLKAGNSGSYNSKSRELRLEPSFNPNKISWKTRELYFDNTPLREAADLLEKVYGVSIQIPDPGLAASPITVSFSDQSLESVLNVLEVTLDLKMSRSGESYVLEGTESID